MDASSISQNERSMATLAHLSAFAGLVFPLGNIIAPVLIWQLEKESMPFAADQAKECLNFQIVLLCASFLLGLVMLVGGLFAAGLSMAGFNGPWVYIAMAICSFILVLPLAIASVVLTIIAAIKANEGISYRYPLMFRVLR